MTKRFSKLSTIPRRLWLGLGIASGSFAGIFYLLSGDVTDSYLERAVRARVSPECKGLKPADTLQIGSQFQVQSDSSVVLNILLFDRIKERYERRRLVGACSSVRYDLNFDPTSIQYSSHDTTDVTRKEVPCRPDFNYCFQIDGDSYRQSRGHITIITGRSARSETFSSRLLEIGFSTTDTRAQIESEISLPQEAIPMNLVPPPVHMLSGASTKLYYQGSKLFGSTKPISGSQRAIIPQLGVKVTYHNPIWAKIEEILILVASTFFGIGVALTIEGWFRTHTSRQRRGEDEGPSNPTDGAAPPAGTSTVSEGEASSSSAAELVPASSTKD